MKVLITGASSGIGLSTAKKLASQGHQIASASRNEERAAELLKALNEFSTENQNHLIVKADLCNQQEIESFLQNIEDKWGNPDVIISNAGIYTTDFPSELSKESLLEQLEINAFQAIRVVNRFLPKMKEINSGNIIFTGSIINIYRRVSAASYTLSKNLLDGFARMLFEELNETSIRITRIQPGSVNTPSFDKESGAPIESFVKPEEIADAISWILNLPPTTQVEEIIIRPTDKNW